MKTSTRLPVVPAVCSLCALLGFFSATVYGAPKSEPAIVSQNPDGSLKYDANERGDRVPDFSHCGYAGGDRTIPNVPVKVVVSSRTDDSTERIQRALDYVTSLPADTNGLRGAVLLLKGRHDIRGGLILNASGVVLRGQGAGKDGTILFAAGDDRRTLIRIAGRNDRTNHLNESWQIADDYVPVGARTFRLKSAEGLKIGDAIGIVRPSTENWIERLGMTEFGGGQGDWRLRWKPGSRDLIWDRVIQSIEGDRVTVDAPITSAIEATFGGGRIEVYQWPGRIRNVGVENLRCESAIDEKNLKDEAHAWMAVTMENVENAWVRQVTAAHFASSIVAIWETCKWITVEDCASFAPVSEEGGYRRHTFFTMGQLTLFLHCWAERGWHDFAVGHCAAGPNAFVQCESSLPLRDSGPIESWASGTLYDNVRIDGNGLSLAQRGSSGEGAGWSAANSVLWQCSAARIICANPPTAQNWAFGCWAEFEGNGIWRHSNEFVRPESLYAAQLADRIGRTAAQRLKLMSRSTEETSNPSVEGAAELIAASRKPAPQLSDHIASAALRQTIPVEPGNAARVEDLPITQSQSRARAVSLAISNGWLVMNGRLLTGGIQGIAWWRGNILPNETKSAEPCLTRFVPGRIGAGYIDDFDGLGDSMLARNKTALDHHYGLWYERRRDDHERVRRIDGDVWPPFYELPFARSGQGTAWDGLSKYDLTRFNPWYWKRLQEFATVCERRGLVLFHQNYFQHNILEAGAHWADFPWRSANNINDTGFPEPPPFAGDKRIFMAEQFYDVTHPVRGSLHRNYIRKCLENFSDNSNVIQFTSGEFTGPLAFMEFWLDTIREWRTETGRHPLVALSCTRDVQDAILADPKRSGLVDLVDFRYWWRTDQGLFAPQGGLNLAPRQFERQWKGGRPTDITLATMAREYRTRYRDKPVICDFDQAGWAFLCAGGSLARLPRSTDPDLLKAIPRMQPLSEASDVDSFVLAEPGKQFLVYLKAGANKELDLNGSKGTFIIRNINLDSGAVSAPIGRTDGDKASLRAPEGKATALWLTHE